MATVLVTEIERRLEERAGLVLAVAEDRGAIVLGGIVDNEEQHQAALDIVTELAGDSVVIDSIEVLEMLPEALEDQGATPASIESDEATLEPGDFTDQSILDSADLASGPVNSLDDDPVADGDEVYVPPTDPVAGPNDEVIGGLQLSSMDSIEVELSSDGTLGDEAIRDAVLRELREDAATTALEIEVEVLEGIVRLTGTVADLDDAESAEEVASRVPGVVEVDEALDVAGLER